MENIEAWLLQAKPPSRESSQPVVTLSYAQSLDGSIAVRRGQPTPLSGQQSLRLTHRLRALHDAILVGVDTVIADDPGLTVRLVPGKNPQPVILDSRLRFPLQARLLQGDCPPWIATLQGAGPGRAAALQAAGARLLVLPADGQGRICLPALLQYLAGEGIGSLMVEGGARVIASFLALGLVDQVVLTIAPLFLGGLRAVESPLGTGQTRECDSCPGYMEFFPRLEGPEYETLGEDLVIRGRLQRNKDLSS